MDIAVVSTGDADDSDDWSAYPDADTHGSSEGSTEDLQLHTDEQT